jgi:nicotinamide riboside kinase
MLIINLFGGPSSGKSTTAAYVFSKLKTFGISCEYINEYAKDCVYEGRDIIVKNDQLYILSKQNHKLKMLELSNQARCAVVDSPLILSNIYGKLYNSITNKFEDFTLELFNSYNNINFFIKRKNGYFEVDGRFQKNIQEAIDIDNQIKEYLNNHNVVYEEIDGVEDFPFGKIMDELIKEREKNGGF